MKSGATKGSSLVWRPWQPWEALPSNYCTRSDPRTPLNVTSPSSPKKRQSGTELILVSARVARANVCVYGIGARTV